MKNVLFRMVAMATVTMLSGAAMAAPIDLGEVMKDMGANMVVIMKSATDVTKNAANAGLCDTVLADVVRARTVMPDSVAALPADQQQAQMSQFQAMLDKLSGQLTQLKADFVANNNAGVKADLAAIIATKGAGHKQFNPQPAQLQR
jgi:hypothetical protein